MPLGQRDHHTPGAGVCNGEANLLSHTNSMSDPGIFDKTGSIFRRPDNDIRTKALDGKVCGWVVPVKLR